MLLHVLVVVTFYVAPTVICTTCCSGTGVGHLWSQCRKRVGGWGGSLGLGLVLTCSDANKFLADPHGAVSRVGLLSTQIQSTKVFCGLYRSAFRSFQRMQYSGFLSLDLKLTLLTVMVGPDYRAAGGGGGTGYLRNRGS